MLSWLEHQVQMCGRGPAAVQTVCGTDTWRRSLLQAHVLRSRTCRHPMYMALNIHAVEQLQHCSPWTERSKQFCVSVLPGLPCCVPPAACAHRPCVSHVETRPKHAGRCESAPTFLGVRFPRTTSPPCHTLFIVVSCCSWPNSCPERLSTLHISTYSRIPCRPARRSACTRRCPC